MIWAAIVFFVTLALVLIIWRDPLAHWQGMIMGGRMPAGCAVAESVVLLILAMLFFVFLREL